MPIIDEAPPMFPDTIFFFESCEVLLCALETWAVKRIKAKQEKRLIIGFIGLCKNHYKIKVSEDESLCLHKVWVYI